MSITVELRAWRDRIRSRQARRSGIAQRSGGGVLSGMLADVESDGEELTPDQLEELLRAARDSAAAAHERGAPYAVAWYRAQAAYVLMQLQHFEAALSEFEEAGSFFNAAMASGDVEAQEALFGRSHLGAPEEALPRSADLRAWIAIGRAAALARLRRWPDALDAIESSRPLVKGWGRRHLRRALDEVSDEVTRAIGTADDALAALDRTIANPMMLAEERLQARYERSARLLDADRVDDARHEALLLLRDADAAGDAWLCAAARQVLGASLLASGDTEAAIATLRLALQGLIAADDPAGVIDAAPGLAWALTENGDFRGAAEVLERALPSARVVAADAQQSARGLRSLAQLQCDLGAARDAAGDARGAIAAFEQAAESARTLGDEVAEADALHGAAVVRSRHFADDHDEAIEALALLQSAVTAYTTAVLPERAAGCHHEAASILARLKSYDAALARYTAARDSYLELPPVLRDAGSWPDEVADCEANIMLIDRLRANPLEQLPDGAFTSGGHQMRHP